MDTFKYSQSFITTISYTGEVYATGEDPKSLEYIWKPGVNSCFFPVCLLVVEIQITVQPQSQQAPVGSRVLLTCRASGPPELKYQWFRGKEEVKPLYWVFLFCLFVFQFQCDLLKTQIIGINWLYGWLCPQILEETGSTPELVLCPLAPIHQGHYICRINHGIKCIFSQWAHVSVIHSAGISCHSSFLPPYVTRCVITYPVSPRL